MGLAVIRGNHMRGGQNIHLGAVVDRVNHGHEMFLVGNERENPVPTNFFTPRLGSGCRGAASVGATAPPGRAENILDAAAGKGVFDAELQIARSA